MSDLITFVGLCAKTAAILSELELGAYLGNKPDEGFASAVTGLFGFITRIETGLAKGLIDVFWKNHHWVEPWAVRLLVISRLLWPRGYFPAGPNWFNLSQRNASRPSITTTPASTGTVPITALKKTPSELAFDTHGVLCQSDELLFSNDIKLEKLEVTHRGELPTRQITPTEPDFLASGVNCSTSHEPLRLCQFHLDVYLSARQLEPCSKTDCRYGYPLSRGKNGLCNLHLSSNETRTSHVSFPERGKTDKVPQPQLLEFYDGLTTMPPTLIKQAIQDCLGLCLKKELDVFKHLTVSYGGLLMENAALVDQHWPPSSSPQNPQTGLNTLANSGPDPLPSGMIGYRNTTTASHGNPPLLSTNLLSGPFLLLQRHSHSRDTSLPRAGCLPAYLATRIRHISLGSLPILAPILKPTHSYGPGFIPPQPRNQTPVSGGLGETSFQSTALHHLGRLANPESQTPSKSGTFESIKRVGEIRAYCARGFDTFPVLLPQGIVGKQLALQLKSLNTQILKIYETTALPTAFAKKLRLAATNMGRGGRSNDPDWVLGNRTFPHGTLLNWINIRTLRIGRLEARNPIPPHTKVGEGTRRTSPWSSL